jgi:hypothetical protein
MMAIRRTVLALVMIAAAGVASGGKSQTVESSHQPTGSSSTLRIAPIDGQGPVQNILDLLNQRGAEAAVVASDVLPYLRGGRFPGVDSSIAYVTKLDEEQVHILARQDIASIADLTGKKVSLGPPDSRSFITGSVLFQALKIRVQPVALDQTQALQQLHRGEIAAILHVAKSPARLFFNLNRDDRVHFLPVPFAQELSSIYLPSRLAPADYPLLIGGGEAGRGVPIATVAVPIVLAVNSRSLITAGNREISRLSRAELLRATNQQRSSSGAASRPDLAMEVPGWRHFVPSESRPRGATSAERSGGSTATRPTTELAPERSPRETSARPSPDGQLSKTQEGSGTSPAATPGTGAYTDQQKQALYRDFLRWRKQFSSHKQPEASEDVFNEFVRSLGSSSPPAR